MSQAEDESVHPIREVEKAKNSKLNDPIGVIEDDEDDGGVTSVNTVGFLQTTCMWRCMNDFSRPFR